jgi:hypothetical protein
MDKHKHNWGRKNPASIDGIVQSGRVIGFPKTTSYQPTHQATTPTLDNFHRKDDGFFPSREAMPTRTLDQSEAALHWFLRS